MRKNCCLLLFVAFASLILFSCSTTKYVPDGRFLLDEVRIRTDNKRVKPSNLSIYVRQNPNTKWFSLIKTQLYVYNWSGRDSTKWVNRALRRLGDAPVIYSEEDSRRSQEEIEKAVRNMGYMGATVQTLSKVKKKKISLTYQVKTGQAYRVRNIQRDIRDDGIAGLLEKDSLKSLLKEGMLFDVNLLDRERQRITSHLLQNGYYKFNKNYISYTADTMRGRHVIDLTLHLMQYRTNASDTPRNHLPYKVDKVTFVTDYNVLHSSELGGIDINDSVVYRGFPIYYKDKLFLRPKVLVDNLRLMPGKLYAEQDMQSTYANFGRLQVLKYTNIRFAEHQKGDSALLNAYVMLTKNKHQSVSFELEGTNSAGDLGAAASVSFQNRNIFKGSETFTFKLRGAYEAISAKQTGYGHDDYKELSAETSINFPRFMFPFLSNDLKRRMRATTEFGLQYNYQLRPEFSRIVASASWRYKWGVQRQRAQHRFDVIDVNYLYMPWIDSDFRELYLNNNQNYILKYNYDNRFIVRMGYNFYYNSRGGASQSTLLGNSYSVRFNAESAGNLLYLLGKIGGVKKNEEGEYTLLNIPFAQYVKVDFDYAKHIAIDMRNSVALHFNAGVAVPYGNAKMVPFEKRYFAGGANGVRGWSVRSLGPGKFQGDGNFLNQTGDVKLDASIEYRTRLFWKLRGALFVDAGNVWTLREYDSQPGGKFQFNSFYKQIAVAYGLGVRLDLDFFILRFDGGMKALNPIYDTSQRDRYPIIRPNFKRDFAFHFAVGYPF